MKKPKKFYTEKLDFQIIWEADWFLLISTPEGEDTIAFMSSNHPTQSLEIFRKPYLGAGVFLTIEIDNVDSYYEHIKSKGIDIALDIRSEEWGDRHFALIDPNNIGIDFVTHTKTE